MASKGIYISLPAKILKKIDRECGGPSLPSEKKRSGMKGGRAAWVRALIYQALGEEEPEDIHEKRKRRLRQELVRCEGADPLEDWVETKKRLRELRDEGLSLRQMAEIMRLENRATRRGGKWSAQTVRNALRSQTR